MKLITSNLDLDSTYKFLKEIVFDGFEPFLIIEPKNESLFIVSSSIEDEKNILQYDEIFSICDVSMDIINIARKTSNFKKLGNSNLFSKVF
jgi:hypothetical protein